MLHWSLGLRWGPRASRWETGRSMQVERFSPGACLTYPGGSRLVSQATQAKHIGQPTLPSYLQLPPKTCRALIFLNGPISRQSPWKQGTLPFFHDRLTLIVLQHEHRAGWELNLLYDVVCSSIDSWESTRDKKANGKNRRIHVHLRKYVVNELKRILSNHILSNNKL